MRPFLRAAGVDVGLRHPGSFDERHPHVDEGQAVEALEQLPMRQPDAFSSKTCLLRCGLVDEWQEPHLGRREHHQEAIVQGERLDGQKFLSDRARHLKELAWLIERLCHGCCGGEQQTDPQEERRPDLHLRVDPSARQRVALDPSYRSCGSPGNVPRRPMTLESPQVAGTTSAPAGRGIRNFPA